MTNILLFSLILFQVAQSVCSFDREKIRDNHTRLEYLFAKFSMNDLINDL